MWPVTWPTEANENTRVARGTLSAITVGSSNLCTGPKFRAVAPNIVADQNFSVVLDLRTVTRSRPNWITVPGLKSGSAGKSESRGPENGVSRWRRPNSDIYSQNYHFGLVYEVIYQFLGMEAKNYKFWYVLPMMPFIRGPRRCRYSTEKCPPDSHLPFVYVIILSISPFWRIRETNQSTKTSKILFPIVMPTFGKSCRRPWLRGLKNQSYVGSSSKFSKMAATGPARGHWAGSTAENLPVSDCGNMFNIS